MHRKNNIDNIINKKKINKKKINNLINKNKNGKLIFSRWQNWLRGSYQAFQDRKQGNICLIPKRHMDRKYLP